MAAELPLTLAMPLLLMGVTHRMAALAGPALLMARLLALQARSPSPPELARSAA